MAMRQLSPINSGNLRTDSLRKRPTFFLFWKTSRTRATRSNRRRNVCSFNAVRPVTNRNARHDPLRFAPFQWDKSTRMPGFVHDRCWSRGGEIECRTKNRHARYKSAVVFRAFSNILALSVEESYTRARARRSQALRRHRDLRH